jgi:hypothetical protein
VALMLAKMLCAYVRKLLDKPAGLRRRISCPFCACRHIDRGIWVYRAHTRHLCEHCGETFIAYIQTPIGHVPYTEPTRGI